MNAENLIVYYSCYRETVEALYKLFPQLQRIPSFALVIKPINSIDGPTLVISPQKEEIFGVLNLIGEQEADHLQVLLPSVHVVSQEKVVRLWWEVTDLENTKQVDVLTVDISRNNQRRIQLN